MQKTKSKLVKSEKNNYVKAVIVTKSKAAVKTTLFSNKIAKVNELFSKSTLLSS